MNKNFTPLSPYLYNVGEIINGLEIIEQTYVLDTHGWKNKAYMVKCVKCGYVYDTPKREGNLKKYGCIVCSGRKVAEGINDIRTTAPWMIAYLESKEDAKKYTCRSNKKLSMICPFCMKQKKSMSPNTLYRAGFSCSYCGDGISYPEKFMMSLLDLLEIDYIYQLNKNNLNWCDSYRYDFYIPNKNMIIETHGRQHYEDVFSIDYKKQRETDLIKNYLAINNGISLYIQLDCRESNKEWIINSIINSKLDKILEFNCNNINWNTIENNSLKSKVFIACNLWNENRTLTTEDIGDILHLSGATIQKYLITGTNIGICNYNSEIGIYRRDLKKMGKPSTTAKKIFYNDNIYDSIKAFADSINQNQSVVGRWIKKVASPRYCKNNIYLSAHYATKEEIKTYPRYEKEVLNNESQNDSLLLCSNE